MIQIVRCAREAWPTLALIWERSVRATHGFLAEEDFREIRERLLSDYFPMVELYAVEDDGVYSGFIGLSAEGIEMLFIDSNRLRSGLGSMLIEFAKGRGATKVDVNEQNHSALGFYLAKGFRVVSRDATDEAGRPYPILHLSL